MPGIDADSVKRVIPCTYIFKEDQIDHSHVTILVDTVSIFGTTYNDIDSGEQGNCPVTTKVGIRNETANQRGDIASTDPIGDVVGSNGAVLIQTNFEVEHKVGAHSIES